MPARPLSVRRRASPPPPSGRCAWAEPAGHAGGWLEHAQVWLAAVLHCSFTHGSLLLDKPSLEPLPCPAQVEALLRLRRFRAAMECLLAARQQHPGFADTEDYQCCVADVQAALEAADVQP